MANLVEYVKTVWENGKTALNAARMNNMEQGISDCATQINKLGDSVSRVKLINKAEVVSLSITNDDFGIVFKCSDGEYIASFPTERASSKKINVYKRVGETHTDIYSA